MSRSLNPPLTPALRGIISRATLLAAVFALATSGHALAQTKARAESLESQGGQNPYWVGAQAVLGANIPGVVGMVLLNIAFCVALWASVRAFDGGGTFAAIAASRISMHFAP